MSLHAPGQIVILNGTPRAGKSSIVSAIQDWSGAAGEDRSGEGGSGEVWLNLGVDRFKAMTPARYQPGIGLRPGGERPDLEPVIERLYAGMYDAIAAHSRLGLNVVVDAVHHDDYSVPRGITADCARRLRGLPVLFVGVRCPLDEVMRRRQATWRTGYAEDGSVPPPVLRWQHAVHDKWTYDLEVDTSRQTPRECAEVIRARLEAGPPGSAFFRVGGVDGRGSSFDALT